VLASATALSALKRRGLVSGRGPTIANVDELIRQDEEGSADAMRAPVDADQLAYEQLCDSINALDPNDETDKKVIARVTIVAPCKAKYLDGR